MQTVSPNMLLLCNIQECVVLHLLDLTFSGFFFKGLYLMLSQKKKGNNYATGVSAAPMEGKSLEGADCPPVARLCGRGHAPGPPRLWGALPLLSAGGKSKRNFQEKSRIIFGNEFQNYESEYFPFGPAVLTSDCGTKVLIVDPDTRRSV